MKHITKHWFTFIGLTLMGWSLVMATHIVAQQTVPLPAPAASKTVPQQRLFNIYENNRLTASDGVHGDYLGFTLASDGNTVVTGATYVNNVRGAVYVFVRDGDNWMQQAKITTSDEEVYHFGYGVALDVDTLVIGGEWHDFAYVFVRENGIWHEQGKLISSDGNGDEDFGRNVAVQGDTAIVSASGRNAVYVFTRSNGVWSEQQKLTPEGATTYENFARGIALEGDTLLLGAPDRNQGQGAVYVFTRSGGIWTQQSRLTVSDEPVRNGLGWSIALQDDTALIGYFGDSQYVGKVYVFSRSGGNWIQQQELTAADGAPFDQFGYSVALDGDNAVIGAVGDDQTGNTYLFTRSNGVWSQAHKLDASNAALYDHTGTVVALEGMTALVGSPGNGGTGTVLIYDLNRLKSGQEMLVNGSFETDANQDYIPDGWSRKNPVGDGIRCNKLGQSPVAYDGQCAYLFKPDTNGDNRLTQNINLNAFDLNTGDKIKLSGFYNKQSAGSVRVSVYVEYSDLPQDQGHITLMKMTVGYQPVNPIAITLKAKPTRVRVVIQNDTTSGKTWFDAMSLKLTTGNGRSSEVVPLPQVSQPPAPLPLP